MRLSATVIELGASVEAPFVVKIWIGLYNVSNNIKMQ